LKDKYAGLRNYTLERLGADSTLLADSAAIEAVEQVARTEKDKKTKATALEILAYTANEKYKPLFEQDVNDSSYSVAGAALEGLNILDSANAYTMAKKFANDAKGKLGAVVAGVIMQNATEEDFDFILKQYEEMPPGQEKFEGTAMFCEFLSKLSDTDKIKRGIDKVMAFRNMIPENYRGFTDPVIKRGLDKIADTKGSEIAQYINNAWKE
jgi:aminopeptidase N